MKGYCFLCMLLAFFGCQNQNEDSHSSLSTKDTLIHNVSQKSAWIIEHKTHLIPFGSGARALDEIKMLSLSFNYEKPLDIPSARELLITSSQIFQSEINSDEQIRSYLHKFPFEQKNIEIVIYIEHKSSDTTSGDLICASSINGILEYEIDSPDKLSLITVFEETYEEALEKFLASRE